MLTSRTHRHRSGKVAIAALFLAMAGCTGPAGVPETERSLRAAGVRDTSSSMLAVADRLAAEGKYAAALPLYRRAHDLGSGDAAALLGLGDAYLKTGRNRDALRTFQDATSAFPRNAAAFAGIGRAWIGLGRPGQALPAFDAALARDPGFADAYNGRGVALAGLGRTDDAISAFQTGLETNPENAALKSNLGLALTLDNQSDLGLPLLEEAATAPDATVRNRRNLALAYGVSGRTADSRAVAAIDLGPVEVDRDIAAYRTIAALPADERAAAVLSDSGAEKRDLTKPANRAFLEPVTAAATLRRLRGGVAAAPTPEPARASAQAKAPDRVQADPLPDMPPLDDHIGYAVQIAAYRHAHELNPGWQELKARYGHLLAGLEPRRSEVDFGDRAAEPSGFFYRLNAGPLKTYGAARRICDAIAAQNGDCWVRPPLPAEGRLPDEQAADKDTPAPERSAAAERPGETWIALDMPQRDGGKSGKSGEETRPDGKPAPVSRPANGPE